MNYDGLRSNLIISNPKKITNGLSQYFHAADNPSPKSTNIRMAAMPQNAKPNRLKPLGGAQGQMK